MAVTITIKEPVNHEIYAIKIAVPVRYHEEDMPYDFPHRNDDEWTVTVDIETGQIMDWPGIEDHFMLHMKVIDMGAYELLNKDGLAIAVKGDYVPDFFPGDHYGDYIIFDINPDGVITNWFTPDSSYLDEFEPVSAQ